MRCAAGGPGFNRFASPAKIIVLMAASTTDKALRLAILGATGVLAGVIYDSVRDRTVQVGETAPDFTITTSTGATLSRANFGGKILVLNFWATWCQPCIRETPALEQLHQRLRDQGIVVVGISVDKHEKKYRDFLKRFNVSFATAHDPAKVVSDRYGTYRYPETYLITRDGRVLQKLVGAGWKLDEMTAFLKSQL